MESVRRLPRRFCSLLSGGKDSNYALYKALQEGWEPSCVLVVESDREDSWMFHTPHVRLALLQLEAMGLRGKAILEKVSGVKEREVSELEEILSRLHKERGFDVIVAGALASRYQYERVKRIASRLGVDVYAPAWQDDPWEYMKELVREGFRFIIIRIAVMGLPPRLLGVPVHLVLEEILVRSRRYGFHPAFEGGEAETLVYDAPHYRLKICLQGRRVSAGMFEHNLVIDDVGLKGKDEAECIRVNGEAYP